MQEKSEKNFKNLLFDMNLYGINYEIGNKVFTNSSKSNNLIDDEKNNNSSESKNINPTAIKAINPNLSNKILEDLEKRLQETDSPEKLSEILNNLDKSLIPIGANLISGNISHEKGGKKILICNAMPTFEDDLTGKILSSDDGIMLSQMIKWLGLDLEKNCTTIPYIFWRTAGGRTPTEIEIELSNIFWNHIPRIINPDIIITFGQDASNYLLKGKHCISKIHGQEFKIKLDIKEIRVIPMFDLNYLIANQNEKYQAFEDLKRIKEILSK